MRRFDRRSVVALLATLLLATLAPLPAVVAAEPGVRVAATPLSSDGAGRSLPEARGPRRVDVSRLPATDGAPTVRVDRAPLRVPAPDGSGPDRGLAAVPPDPSLATILADAPPVEAVAFAGLGFATGTATETEPPDPWVAVGPDHVMQAVNTSIRISRRNGSTVLTTSLFDFFGLSEFEGYQAETFDPRVIYDSLHGRWIAIEAGFDCLTSLDAAVGTGYLDVAVSDTADPTGTWTIRSIAFPDALPDYPGLGTTTDKVLLSSNVFGLVADASALSCGPQGAFLGTEIDVVAWSELKSAGEVNVAYLTGGDAYPNYYFSWRPALQAPATSATGYVVGQDATFVDGLPSSTWGDVAYLTITGSPAGGGITTVSAITDLTDAGIVAAFEVPEVQPAQPNDPATIVDAVDQRPTDAVWQNGLLAVVATHPCDAAGGAVETRNCVRIMQLTTGGATPTRRQDFLIAEDGADLFMGGVGYARNGDLHMMWTRSSAAGDGYPSSYAASQPVGTGLRVITAPDRLQPGTGTYPGTRWGDYVGVAQDPQVPNAVWGANQYSAGASYWGTRVSQIQGGGSTYTSITPLRVLDSRTGVGASGAFSSSSAREFVVAGFSTTAGSIPDDAIAVTGNVTVTGQTAAGYVSITTTKTSTPTTSTINVPLGDTRANNVTVPLSRTGRLSAVFKGPSGSKAHVVFDVTGYFVAGDADAGYTPITPVRVLDSRPGGVGLYGAFQMGVPRKLVVAGANGIPNDAVAITANLTVVGQTRAGYVSVTPASDASPDTSTINFPVGDTRANGLTADLDDGGDVWLVYVAGASASTHLILDVTGYYRPSGAGLAFYPLEPGRIMDTRTSLLSGLTGQLTSGTPRTLSVVTHWGVPGGAEAITGNLTVVGQTAAGYVSATPVADATPDTSTINFPKGDVRANGITVPLSDDGKQAFVYKSSTGAKTHLILDVTGYFR